VDVEARFTVEMSETPSIVHSRVNSLISIASSHTAGPASALFSHSPKRKRECRTLGKDGRRTGRFRSRCHLDTGLPAAGRVAVLPFYTYAEDGTHRRENITDWPSDNSAPTITTLHHQVGHLPLHLRRPASPEYREALRRQPPPRTPRIPSLPHRFTLCPLCPCGKRL